MARRRKQRPRTLPKSIEFKELWVTENKITPLEVEIQKRLRKVIVPLQDQIRTIQDNCQHNLVLNMRVYLVESLVLDVFVGQCLGPLPVALVGAGQHVLIYLICKECSKTSSGRVDLICPNCIKPLNISQSLESREKYFGSESLSYKARISSCNICHIKIVSDVYLDKIIQSVPSSETHPAAPKGADIV